MSAPFSAPAAQPSLLSSLMQRAYASMRQRSRARPPQRRRVALEALEPRVLLSADLFDAPGLGSAAAVSAGLVREVPASPPVAVTLSGLDATGAGASVNDQVFWLSTGGAVNIDYRGPVVVDGIDVAAFSAAGTLAGLESEILASMLDTLDLAFAPFPYEFTLDRPEGSDYSTIFIGAGASWFEPWGVFGGLAEQVDAGNADRSDIAFVFTDVMNGSGLSAETYGRQLGGIVAHEAGHLLGLNPAHASTAGNPLASVAFDPKVHVAIGTEAADDAADGKVTIDGKEYVVHPLLVQALNEQRPFYNGGAVAGDGFPDVLMGQFAIHPIDHGTWLTRVLDMAWAAQSDTSFTATEKSQILAWSYGFLTHSAGDHFAHTLVNSFAEGVAPGFGAAAVSIPTDQRDLGNMLRHFMTEAYIADALPGFDGNKTDRTEIVVGSGDFTDDTTPAIAYDAPIRFIYETFLRAFPNDPTPVVEMAWDKGTLTADAATHSFTRSDVGLGLLDGFVHDGFKVGHKITVSGFDNAANNGTFFVTGVTPTVLTVSGALAGETATGDEKIAVYVAKTVPAVPIVASAATNTFTRSDGGSFVTDGFVEGMRFDALGLSANFRSYIVKTVTPNVITVVGHVSTGTGTYGDTFSELADETGLAQLVGIGQRGPGLDNILKLRDAVFAKAAELGARGDPAELETIAGQLIEYLVQGKSISSTEITALKDPLFKAYLYNWADEIDEGVRHWGELGLAFTKAMFDAGSRRELQQRIGDATGFADSADKDSIRSEAEDGVGILDVLLNELEDPNGDGLTFDSFINRHLLPMAGLPAELGMLRSGMDAFSDVVSEILQPLKDVFNPLQAAAHDVKNYVKDFLKDQFKERFGIDFEVVEYLKGLGNKMDLASITLPVTGDVVPVFKPGDHERLDALLGLPADHHAGVAPVTIDKLKFTFTFYDGAQARLADNATMGTISPFAAFDDAVTLTKMIYLMESPADDAVDGAGAAAGQLSQLYGDILTKLDGGPGPAINYDFSLLNLHGAHGGNVLTSTLPGVPGRDGQTWMGSIDADQVWRQDNYTVNNTLFRVGEFNDIPSAVIYEATALAAGTYKVYASWQGNVTQDLDNLANSAFPDQKLSPTQFAQYTVSIWEGGVEQPGALTFQMDQRNFANDLDDGGLGFEQLKSATQTDFTLADGQTLRITLSDVTGENKHVIAGPILLVRTTDQAKFRIQNNRDPVTLLPVATPGFTYVETVPGAWVDLVYSDGGHGNNPLWESATLRPVFRELFSDWLNTPLDFPDLGDATSPDPNTVPIAKVELPSHATVFGPKVADNDIDIPITTTVKGLILDGLQGAVDLAAKLQTSSPLDLDLPGLGKSLGELIQLSSAIRDGVQQPVIDYFIGDATPTFRELFTVVSPSLGGGGSGSALEFDLDLRAILEISDLKLSLGAEADALGLELNGSIDLLASFGFVDPAALDQPLFSFGIDLSGSLALADRIYVRAETFVLHAAAHADMLDFGARVAFLSVGVEDGSVDLTLDVRLDFIEPSGDGRITLGEVFGASSTFFDDTVITASGTLDVVLPLEVGGLPGLASGSLGTLEFHASNLFDKTTYALDTSDVNADVFNFDNIDAAAVVTLVAQLSDQLDNMRQGGTFDGIDIPFIDGAVSAVLDFAEVVSDGLLYDDGADGLKDGTDRLVTDINVALASAGLANAIVAQADGTHIDFQVIDRTVDGFTVEAGAGDGGGFALFAFAPGAAVFADAQRATPPAGGVLGSNAKLKFTLKRGGQLTATTVTLDAADTAGNTGIGDDVVKLVRADNSATFATAQDLAFRMSTILGFPGLVAYDPGTQALTIKVGDLLPTFTLEKGFDIAFDVDLGPLLDIQSDTQVHLRAAAGIDPDFVIGIYLGDDVPGAQSSLETTTTLASLNDGNGVDIKTEPALTTVQAIGSTLRALSGDATFAIALGTQVFGAAAAGTDTLLADPTKNFVGKVFAGDQILNLTDGSVAIVVYVSPTQLTTTPLTGGTDITHSWGGDSYMTVPASHTLTVPAATPATMPDLVAALNSAIEADPALKDMIVAVADGNRLRFEAADPDTLSSFIVAAASANPAAKDLGFGSSAVAQGALVGSALSAFALVQGDAVFRLTIGAEAYDVRVTKASTTGNVFMVDLVADVVDALAAARRVSDNSVVSLLDKVVVENDGLALVLRIKDPALAAIGFSAALDGPAVLELGFADEATITKPQVRAAKDVATVVGRLTADTTLTIATTGGPSGQVTLYADDTATNTTILSLVNDLNQALALPSIKTGVLTSFPLGPVSFTVKVGAGTATLVTVPAGDLTGNTSLSDLVADINKALKTYGLDGAVIAKPAGFDSTVGPTGRARIEFEAKGADTSSLAITADAGNGLNLAAGTTVATSFAGKLVAGSVGNKLVISAVDGSGVTAFTVTSDAQGGSLGLPAGDHEAGNVDFVIRLSDGTTHDVTLDPAVVTDIGTLIAAIEGAVSDVEVTINAAGTGLSLTDTTFQAVVLDANGKLVSNPNTATFMVSAVNGSAAAAQLRIVGLDSMDGASLDGRIDGGQLTGTKLTDRFFLRDLALNASLTLDTPDGVDASANFGFIGITLTGSADLQADLRIGLKDPGTSLANDEVSLTEFIKGLSAPLTLIDPPSLTGLGQLELGVVLDGDLPFITLGAAKVGADVNLGDLLNRWDPVDLTNAAPAWVSGTTFSLTGDFSDKFLRGARVTVPSASFGAFVESVSVAAGVTTVTLLDNGVEPISLPTDLSGLAIDTPAVPILDFHTSGLDNLLSFENPNFDFASIIDALLLVRDLLSEIDAVDSLLNEPIPLVDISVNDLLEFADTFSDALTAAQNDPAASLQQLDRVISEAFGVDAEPADPTKDLLRFSLDDFGTADDASDDIIKLELNLGAAFNRSLSVRIPDLGLPEALGGVVDFGGSATLAATGSASFALDIGIGLDDPTKFYLYDSSGLQASLALTGSDMAFRAALGPVSLSVFGGEASIVGTVGVSFAAAHFTDHRKQLESLADVMAVLGDLDVSFAAPVSADLPVFFPTESNGIGSITLAGNLVDIGNGLFLKDDAADVVPVDKITLDISNVIDGLVNGFSDISLLDQILFVVDGVDLVLGGVQDALDGEILGFSLPLIGDKLASGADVIGDFRDGFMTDFRNEVEKLADPSDNGIKDILTRLLGASGLDLLMGDIQTFNNLGTATSVADAEIWWKMKIGGNLVNAGADIGLDLGIPGLGLETDGEIQLDIGWELDLGFGLSGKDGFFLFVDDPDELRLNVDVTLPGGSLKGTLGFLEFTAFDKDVDGDGDSTHLSASFAIDIHNSSDVAGQPPDERLGLSELGRMGFDVLLDAEASAELAMTLGIAGDQGGFPQIQADFRLEWAIDGDPNTAGAQPINLFAPPPGFSLGRSIQDGLQLVEFRNVSLDVGSYISNVVSPLLQKIQEVTEPVMPIIEIVTTPLPVLSDLGLNVTLLDIAKQTGAVNPAFIEALETILDVVALVNSIEIPADGSLLVPFGSFTVFDRDDTAFASFGDLGSGNFDLEDFASKALDPNGPFGSLIAGLPAGLQDVLGEVAGVAGDVLSGLSSSAGAGGGKSPFSFPIIEDPSQVFGLLMGKPAVLVAYDMPPLDFKAEFSAFFSIFGPLGVSINLEAALTIDFAFGYDTKGFTDFADSGYKNPLLLANGLYVSDDPTNPLYDGTGDDPPELTFDGGLWAAAELNLGIARGGVGGGIFIGVDFNLFDNDDDGRVRLDELVGNFLNQLKAPGAEKLLAPLAVFDVSGQITAELFAFLKIDFGLFELNKKFNITPPVVLADFDVNFFRPPLLASEMDNGDLIINIGDFAAQRLLGNTSDIGEQIFVESAGAGLVNVWAGNLGSDASVKQQYRVTGRVIAIGGDGDDLIDLSGLDASVAYEIDGGSGADTLKGGAGGGVIRGGSGNDVITGGAGNDLIFGNEGNDTVHAGGGADIVFGDNGEIDEAFDLANRHGFVRAVVTLTDGDDRLYGEDGDDLLFGSGGIDTIDGGKNNDTVIGDGALVTYASPGVVSEADEGTAGFGDILMGGDDDDWIYGGKGNDTIDGNGGIDVIFGGSGSDLIHGNDGADVIFGDNGSYVAGVASLIAGGDADTIFGDDGDDLLLGGGGNDVMFGGNHADTMRGGTGVDTMHGDAGNDFLFGESDPDKLYGDAGADYLEGGQGNDFAWGGTGDDLLVGGYGSDVLDGEADSDTYRITARGGLTTELTTAYDSGGATGTDVLILVGTPQKDTVLLRAMADFYFPTLVKLIGDAGSDGLTDKIIASGEPDKLRAVLQALEDAYGPHDIPDGLIRELIDLFVAEVGPGVLSALSTAYDAANDPKAPSKDSLIKLLADDKGTPETDDDTGILLSDSRAKLDEIRKAVTEAYQALPGNVQVPATMLDDIADAWNTFVPKQGNGSLLADIESAITNKYRTELEVLGSDTDTGFVALINNGGAAVERFNYRDLEGLTINTLAGDDYVVSDDVIAATTINLGLGNDRVQIGQVFRSERVRDPGTELITGITAEDVFTTLEITRGWLSNGVSRPTTVNGGDDSDQFTVFRNVAVLNLNGGDGDDVFTVRAFALKGSTDSERARTDMKGDGGADTILYAVNAPVGIDGGDGFDTVRIVGTEFADDFVITDAGVFGGGLNVSYVNIEKLVADGAEGDDRFFVQSTGLEVVTEIDGGLGSDSFFVGGNPSNAPVAVISNDFKGHSGVILHSVESGDVAWNDVPVEGVSANVGDDEEDFVILRESEGFSRVMEGALLGGAGLVYDFYGIRLTRAPGAGQVVRIAVVPAGMSPEDEAKGFKDLEFYAATTSAAGPVGGTLGFNALTGAANAPVLEFTTANWDQVQYVYFKAADDAASEGRRFVFVNHTLQNSTDPDYQSAQMRSVKVEMLDNDRDGVIVIPSGRGNTVLEDGPAAAGFTDTFDVVLSKAPTHDVTVTMSLANDQIVLSGPTVSDEYTLTFTTANWNEKQTVTITAPDDAVVEGFHTDYISFTVTSADVDQLLPSGLIQIDGDFDLPDVQAIPLAKPTTYVLLPNRPDVTQPITVSIDGVVLAADRYAISGNTLTFLSNGAQEQRTGIVRASYLYKEEGYNGSFVKDSVVDIYDEDSAMVIVDLLDDGSLDVIEGSTPSNGTTDQYSIRLSRAPTADVTITVDAVKTRSTYGRTALFQEQVTVNGLSATTITFTTANWATPQFITVAAVVDTVFDGNDTQVFAPDLQTVNKIRGPLIIEGAAGAGSLSLPRPLMLPSERNFLAPDGFVQGFAAGSGGGAIETMEVLVADLDKVLLALQQEDSTIDAIDKLIGKTLEMSRGPGTGLVLDPLRPEDVFDRFWLITAISAPANGKVTLSLQNPSLVDPAQSNVTAPTTASQYAITSLSINFFADEREQVDVVFVYDNDSVANDRGALTSADGVVRGFTPSAGDSETMVVETAALQAVARLLSDDVMIVEIDDLVGRRLEITVGPGLGRAWTITGIDDGIVPDTKLLTLAKVDNGVTAAPTDRSEFRVEGGDSQGRIVGFGMGPNILFNGRPQPGGITYGDIEVVQVNLGRGNDEVRVDYATRSADHTTRRSGDFYTLTTLDTGAGDDTVTVNLQEGDDGAFSLNLNTGDDTLLGGASTAPLVAFGWDGEDELTGGSGADILFGDRGRVDYVNSVPTDHDNDGGTPDVLVDQIVTRLGHSVPANPVNPPVGSATATTLTDLAASFSTAYGGLVGLSVQAISSEGRVQYRTIVANTATEITIDRPWDQTPNANYFYRISNFPEDQTDGLVRGARVVWSIDDETGADDRIWGGGGRDLIIGGAGDDILDGGAGADWMAGDDARFDFVPVAGTDGPTRLLSVTDPGIAGDDTLIGGGDDDLLIGGYGSDDLRGNAGHDVLIGDAVRVDFDASERIVRIETLFNGRADNGADDLYGGDGHDLAIGGGKGDLIEGDADNALDTAPAGSGRDVLIGDAAVVLLDDTGLVQINAYDGSVDGDDGEAAGADTIRGGADDDLIIGGFGSDVVAAGSGRDLVHGDVAFVDFDNGVVVQVETLFRADVRNGADTLRGEAGEDVLIGGGDGDRIDGGSDDDLIFGDAVRLDLAVGSGNAVSPRYRQVAGTLYGEDGRPLVGASAEQRQGGNPAWGDWTIELDRTLEAGRFGDDYIAGGADDDTIFGQRGNDTIQGDGSIDEAVAASRDTGVLVVDASVEASTDGDDYIEGNAGDDLIFGNLGQDDIVGGSSTAFVFSLPTADRRDDGSDTIFGGAGTERLRNEAGNVVDEGDSSHARDADMILGDNGNIFRIVDADGAARSFNYDDYGGERIVVRAAGLDDYTPGNEAGTGDQGAGDELHGESGDDFVYGMTGNDVLFGEGQDDDLIGGWGHDWISGGTGDDGVLGDDGRILTSRNATAYGEPLNGVAALKPDDGNTRTLSGDMMNEAIATPGGVQSAIINAAGELKKAADLTPFGREGDTLHDAARADDIVYGGWGNDFLHGGWGDDAVSGAEALAMFYDAPANAGDVLRYGQARAGEFADYLEYTPMVRQAGFLLNFDLEGPLVAGSTAIRTDGNDRIFGDLGNDWIVGGTGRDTMYGGWGDDLLNADDDQKEDGNLNQTPDTHASYEDRAYGGAGRDVLIGNTGGDRLIDWVGEFNSFVVPFAPFGQATVSRTLQPQLAEFLYALSASDGADQTLGNTDDPRNGEPLGELGLVRQQDFAWKDQTGGPADPQAGNIPGGKRDVLRGADFNDGQMQALAPDSGTWQVSGGALQVASNSNKGDAVAVYQVGDALPSYFEVVAKIKIVKPTGGWNANSYVIFDYQDATNFKFAGLNASTNKLEMGVRTDAGWQVLEQTAFPGSIKSDKWFNVMLSVNGLTATLIVDNASVFSHTFAPTVVDGWSYGLNWGLVGFGANKSRGAIDNIAVQVVPPEATVERTEGFDAGAGALATGVPGSTSGSWVASGGRYVGAPTAGGDAAVQLLNLSGVTQMSTDSLLRLSATFSTAGRAGIVFDRYSDIDFKFAAIDVATQQILIGHRLGTQWVIDAAVTSTKLNATGDFKLGVTIRGSTVSVTLDGQAAIGFAYNAVAVDGRFGLWAGAAGASFDSVTVSTNDPAVPATQSTGVQGTGTAALEGDASLSESRLQALADEARRRWTQVEDVLHLAALDGLEIVVADLPGTQLAEFADGRITVDVDAAGNGWFLDTTPGDDLEFDGRGAVLEAIAGGAAAGRVDLLSVLSHEMGHAMGLGHSAGGVMDGQLLPGQRTTPERWYEAQDPAFEPMAATFPSTPPQVVAIDWTLPAQGKQLPQAAMLHARPAAAEWQQRFVNQLGLSKAASHPNSALRLHIPVSPELAPRVSVE